MSNKAILKLDWCNHEAVRYACSNWHYSKSVPPGKLVKIGAWEADKFIGCVLFARGASSNLLKPYGLEVTEGAELARVALNDHQTPVSRIVTIAVKFLRRHCPGLRLLVSFADPAQGHHGGIYQACNWIYLGQLSPSCMYRDKRGKLWHERMISERGWNYVFGRKRRVLKPSECEKIRFPGKHRYVLPLGDDQLRKKLLAQAKPYPKSSTSAGSVDGGTSCDQQEGGGSIPTPALSDRGSTK